MPDRIRYPLLGPPLPTQQLVLERLNRIRAVGAARTLWPAQTWARCQG